MKTILFILMFLAGPGVALGLVALGIWAYIENGFRPGGGSADFMDGRD